MAVMSICPAPGCGAITPGGRCAIHKRHGDPRRHEKQVAQGRNTRHWKRIRKLRIELDEHTCQACGGSRCGNAGLTAHLDPRLQGDHRAATLDDCITLGRVCHGSIDAPRAAARRRRGRVDERHEPELERASGSAQPATGRPARGGRPRGRAADRPAPVFREINSMKTCKRCSQAKSVADFPRHRRTRDGLSSWCRDCHNAAVRRWRQANRDQARAVQAASDLRRRGQADRSGGPLQTRVVVAMRRDAKRCALCAKPFNTRRRPEIDHVVPFAMGGSNAPDNLRVVCQSCNRRRPKDGSDVSGRVRLWQLA